MPLLVRTEGLDRRPVRNGRVRTLGGRMLRAVRLTHAEWSVLLCTDPVIRRLNREYRHRDRPTDVLAFAQLDEGDARRLYFGSPKPNPEGVVVLGDVVVSMDTAREQAREQRVTIVRRVTELLAHGLLHLLGFDHRDRAEERIMAAKTDMLVASALRFREDG